MRFKLFGEVNPWVLLVDGKVIEIDRKNTHVGDIIEHDGQSAIVITRGKNKTAKLKKLEGLSDSDRVKVYEDALKNNGKIDVKGSTGVSKVNKGTPKAVEGGKATELLDELKNSGVKYNPNDLVTITKTADGKLVWLENGSETAGLKHIIKDHGTDFANKGIAQDQIPDYITKALSDGKVVEYQGRGTGRPIYEFTYNGTTQRVAITTGSNGFIVGANPVSIK